MATTADFRNGLCLDFNNDLYTIVQFQHVKPGKGGAFVRSIHGSYSNVVGLPLCETWQLLRDAGLATGLNPATSAPLAR